MGFAAVLKKTGDKYEKRILVNLSGHDLPRMHNTEQSQPQEVDDATFAHSGFRDY